MKLWITRTAASVLALATISLAACKKDEVQATLTPNNTASLTATNTTLVLKSVDGASTATSFTWAPITFNWSNTSSNSYSPTVTYTLQLDKKGNNFAAPVSIAGEAGPKKDVTVASLNGALISLGLAPETVANIEVRLVASYANNITPLYSPAVAMTLTPYSTELYVSSSYLNNDLTKAPKLVEIDGSPRQYQGYVYFGGTTASTFKVTNTRAGTGSFYGNASTATVAVGTAGTATTGSLATPGNNFTIPAGYYLVSVNLNAMTWSVTPYTWAVIGSATTNGWNGDTPMTYDVASGLWKITTTLTTGTGSDEFKFRANGNWNVSLGDTSPIGTYLTANSGANLKSPGAGTFTISLNLSDASKPTYTVTK